MKDKFENLMQKARLQGGLAPEEKKRLRRNLETVMLTHPAQKPVLSGWVVLVRQHVFVSALAVIFLFVGTGSALAEGALPGDFLYKFKTGVNEQVRGWLAFSGEDKSEWQLSLAERRLKEIEILAENEELTSEEETRLVEKVDSYTSAVLGNKVAMKTSLKEETNEATDFSRSASLKTADSSSGEEVVSTMMATGLSENGLPENIGIEARAQPPLSLNEIKSLKEALFEKKYELFEIRKSKDRGEYLRLKANILSAERQLISATLSLRRGDLEKAQKAFEMANETFSSLSEEKTVFEGEVRGDKVQIFEGETSPNQSSRVETGKTIETTTEDTGLVEVESVDRENETEDLLKRDDKQLPVGIEVNLGL